jgi:predicted nucleotidyltransferase
MSSAKKALKVIAFTAVAQEHHNAVKMRNVLKWLKTGHEVRIQINGKTDRQKAMESIFKQLETNTRSGAQVIQKVVKPDSIKFYLRPTEEAANIVIEESQDDELKNVDALTRGKDVLSDDFENELVRSIEEDRKKSKEK